MNYFSLSIKEVELATPREKVSAGLTVTSPKHAYIIIYTSKTEVYRGILHYFSFFFFFDQKHRLWVFVRIASPKI